MTDPFHGADDVAPPAIAPDGSPVLLYRRLPAGDEPGLIAGCVPAGASILELGAGAGRVTHPLVRLGFRVTAVDESPAMLAWVHGAERIPARIESLALRDRFDAVLLASHLVNTPDDARRARFLEVCRWHVAEGGVVLIEHHPADWLDTAQEGETRLGDVTVALQEIRRDPPLLGAVSVCSVDGFTFRQPFTARILSADELGQALRQAGLEPIRALTPTWTLAGIAGRAALGPATAPVPRRPAVLLESLLDELDHDRADR